MDNIYTITLNYKLLSPNADKNFSSGSFSAKVICTNNQIKGVTEDKNYLIFGTFVQDKGVILTKINAKNKFDVTSYKLFKNYSSYQGEMFVDTQFGGRLIGNCKANINLTSFFLADSNVINLAYHDAAKIIAEQNGLGNFLLTNFNKSSAHEDNLKELNNYLSTKNV